MHQNTSKLQLEKKAPQIPLWFDQEWPHVWSSTFLPVFSLSVVVVAGMSVICRLYITDLSPCLVILKTDWCLTFPKKGLCSVLSNLESITCRRNEGIFLQKSLTEFSKRMTFCTRLQSTQHWKCTIIKFYPCADSNVYGRFCCIRLFSTYFLFSVFITIIYTHCFFGQDHRRIHSLS